MGSVGRLHYPYTVFKAAAAIEARGPRTWWCAMPLHCVLVVG